MVPWGATKRVPVRLVSLGLFRPPTTPRSVKSTPLVVRAARTTVRSWLTVLSLPGSVAVQALPVSLLLK